MGKGEKWSPVDPRHFEGLSRSDLEKDLVRAQKFTADHPQFEIGWHNEYVQELKRRIAEMIGRR